MHVENIATVEKLTEIAAIMCFRSISKGLRRLSDAYITALRTVPSIPHHMHNTNHTEYRLRSVLLSATSAVVQTRHSAMQDAAITDVSISDCSRHETDQSDLGLALTFLLGLSDNR